MKFSNKAILALVGIRGDMILFFPRIGIGIIAMIKYRILESIPVPESIIFLLELESESESSNSEKCLNSVARSSVIVRFVLTNEKLPLANLIKSEAPIGPFAQNKTDDH